MDPDEKRQKTVYLSDQMIDWLEALAEVSGNSFNEQVRVSLTYSKKQLNGSAPEDHIKDIKRQQLLDQKEHLEHETAVIDEKLNEL